MAKKKSFWNDRRTGFIFGLLIPTIVLGFFYQSTKSDLTFSEYLYFLDQFKVLTKVIALSAIANLATFFIFYKKEYDESVRGIIVATILITIGVVLMKL
jgi:hypothetical protein